MLTNPDALALVRESAGGGPVVDQAIQEQIAGSPGLITGASPEVVDSTSEMDGSQVLTAAETVYAEAITTQEPEDGRRGRFGRALGRAAAVASKVKSASSNIYWNAGARYGNMLAGVGDAAASATKGNEKARRIAPAIAPALAVSGALALFAHISKQDSGHLINHAANTLASSGGTGGGHSQVINAELMADVSPAPAGSTHHVASQTAETLTTNGTSGTSGHDTVVQVELTAKHSPAVNDTPILESHSDHKITHAVLTADTHPATGTPEVLHIKTGQTVSEAYDNLPGSFNKNWDQMVHDAKAAHAAGQLREIHRNGIFYYEVPDGHGGWTSNDHAVLKVMADHSGGRVTFESTDLGGGGGDGNGDINSGGGGHNNAHDILSGTGADSGIEYKGDGRTVTLINGHTLRVSLPANELAHSGHHYFDIHIPGDGIKNGHLDLSLDQQSNVLDQINAHGSGATINLAPDGHTVTGIDFNNHGLFIDHGDLQLPSGYTIDSVSADHTKMVIITPSGKRVTVETPNAWNEQTGYDWGQVQQAIHKGIPRLQEDNDATSSIMTVVPAADNRGGGGDNNGGSSKEGGGLNPWEIVIPVVGVMAAAAGVLIVRNRKNERSKVQRSNREESTNVILNPATHGADNLIEKLKKRKLWNEFRGEGYNTKDPAESVNDIATGIAASSAEIDSAEKLKQHLADQGIDVEGVEFEEDGHGGYQLADTVSDAKKAELAKELTGRHAPHSTEVVNDYVNTVAAAMPGVDNPETVKRHLADQGINVRGVEFVDVGGGIFHLAESVPIARRKALAQALAQRYGWLPPHDRFLGNAETTMSLNAIAGLLTEHGLEATSTDRRTEIDSELEAQINRVLNRMAWSGDARTNKNAAAAILSRAYGRVTYNETLADPGDPRFTIEDGYLHQVARRLAEYAPARAARP
ncbi:MAG TPA: hypothetical protein VLG47_01025 [Candidatus Saccharimonadales bacterium]|nr:hypothetical protein [Candidatus Saccharimonadales bacterium]